MMFHFVSAVHPLPNHMLCVTFKNGAMKSCDVKPLFQRRPAFQALQTVDGLFDRVSADAGGFGVVWNDGIDPSCEELWENGVKGKE